jgi:hypothetical protein
MDNKLRERMDKTGFSVHHICRTRPVVSTSPHFEALEGRCLMTLAGHQLFPSDNPWNQVVNTAPAAANSAVLVATIGATRGLHPDFGAAAPGDTPIGIPYNIVSGTQPKVTVVIDAYPGESDLVPVPIPPGALREGEGVPLDQYNDRHVLVYDKDNNVGYELYNVRRPSETSDGMWHADSEAVWDYSKDYFRTPGYGSADAAGLAILPGLVRPDEVLDQGVITHALRITVPRTANQYVYPASHVAGSGDPATTPRMGERFRLRANFDTSGFPAVDRVILQALKDYGGIVADNGGAWFVSGEPSDRWDNNALSLLGQVKGSDFQALDLTPRVTGVTPAAGSGGGQTVTVAGSGFGGGAGLTRVLFGGVAASGVTVASDGQITCVAPSHAAGTVDVVVRSPYGDSPLSSADQYTFQSDVTAPRATQVQVAGGNWDPGFVGYLGSNGYGTGGYAIPAGAQQQATLPWVNLNQVRVQFNEDLNVTQDALAVRGVNVASYTVTGFAYDAAAHVATWTLAQPIGTDSVTIDVSDAVTDRAGNRLDGEWQNGSSAFPSGNGTAGGHFVFGFNVVQGDANRDTFTLGDDVVAVRSRQGAGVADSRYAIWFDVNGDGFVLGDDVVAARANQGRGQPPATAAGPAPAMMLQSAAMPIAADPSSLSPAAATAPRDASALGTSLDGDPVPVEVGKASHLPAVRKPKHEAPQVKLVRRSPIALPVRHVTKPGLSPYSK